MAFEIRFLGHAAFTLRSGGTTVLVDPFLTGNPNAAVSADEVQADAIVVTHSHGDHVGDTVAIAKRTGAPVVAVFELADELAEDGAPTTHDPGLGGTVEFDWGWVRVQPAWHTSMSAKERSATASGMLIHLDGTTVYHLGDTALFSDLALVKRRQPIDVALMPIGGHYTMDRHDAAYAAELVAATTVIPCHYNTFPVIETDPQAFKADVEIVGASQVVVLAPGETHTL